MTRKQLMWLISAFALIGVAFFVYDDYTSRDWREHCAKERKDNDRMQKEAECKKCEDIIVKDLCSRYKDVKSVTFKGYSVVPMGGIEFMFTVNNDDYQDMDCTINAADLKITGFGWHAEQGKRALEKGDSSLSSVRTKYNFSRLD